MHCTKVFFIGLVSLASTIAANTAKANGKPALAKRLYTTVSGDCTAVCEDPTKRYCCVNCSPSTKVRAAIAGGSSTTFADGECTAICNYHPPYTSSLDCVVHCAPTPAPTPALQKRVLVTATHDGCTAVCSGESPPFTCDDPWCDPYYPAQTPALFSKPLLEDRAAMTTLAIGSVSRNCAIACAIECAELLGCGQSEYTACVDQCPRLAGVTTVFSMISNFVTTGNLVRSCDLITATFILFDAPLVSS